MFNARFVTIALLTLVLISMISTIIVAWLPPSNERLATDSYSTRTIGHRALFELLQRLEVPVQRNVNTPEHLFKIHFKNNLGGFRSATASDARNRDEGLAALLRGASDAADEVVPPERRSQGIFEMGSRESVDGLACISLFNPSCNIFHRRR